jgi:hypothetical protein
VNWHLILGKDEKFEKLRVLHRYGRIVDAGAFIRIYGALFKKLLGWQAEK